MDFATSTVPEGRVAVARATGNPLPPGCLVDRDGQPSTDPRSFYDGGALLPFGAHKGSALMLMVEILATTLAGSAPISSPEYRMGNPTFILAWSVDRFTALGEYHRLVGELLDRAKHSAPAAGCEEVLLPGEIEARLLQERSVKGVPLSDAVWRELVSLAEASGVKAPAPLSG
jgi:LDH2 family malate/lactate/ureidoglycolate dehydrogenase